MEAIDATVRRLLAPIFVVSGAIVVAGFFFPAFVGDVISGHAWLTVALVFFGSGLGYLSLLPLEVGSAASTGAGAAEDDTATDPRRMFVVQRYSRLETIVSGLGRQDSVIVGAAIGGLLVFFGGYLLAPTGTLWAIEGVRTLGMREFGWLFTGPILLSVVFCLGLLVGPWGKIKLGGPDAEPTYTYPVYFTMIFTAGIAAGIVFWGPAEALFHYQEPPPTLAAQPESEAAITGALTYTLFHWGISAWSAYVVIGLPIAYFVYEHGAPLRVSTILIPFLGVDGLTSRWGILVDLLAIFATIGGIATSVALVSQQFLAGIEYQWDVTTGIGGPIVFVGGLTAIFVISAQSGVHRGIRRLSVVTICLFGLVSVLIFVTGPRTFILERGAAATGAYVLTAPSMSLVVGTEWSTEWTVWNWAWWFSWAPFAGLFLAALSKGRRIRTVVFTGAIATAGATMLWFLLIGGAALEAQHTGRADILGAMSLFEESEAVAGFPLFEALALSELLMFLFLALMICFIATSADTSTLVVSILAARRGVAPTLGAIVFWGVFQGAVAIAVLLTGSAQTLQTAAVLTGGPFAFLSVLALVGLIRTLLEDHGGHTALLETAQACLSRIRGK